MIDLKLNEREEIGIEHGVEWRHSEAAFLASPASIPKRKKEEKRGIGLVEAIIDYFMGRTPRKGIENMGMAETDK
jgi:hypothetical protein